MFKVDSSNFFDQKAGNYDSLNRRNKLIIDSLHALISLILKNLPRNARILCVGAGTGTGTEIINLAERYPDWQFVALDPSREMLSKCQDKLENNGLAARCNCIHGCLSDIDHR